MSASHQAKDLADELAGSTAEERAQADAVLSMRARATELAAELGLDAGDVYHVLRNLSRSPRATNGLPAANRFRQKI